VDVAAGADDVGNKAVSEVAVDPGILRHRSCAYEVVLLS
jgi:hypothetical protein